MREPIFDRKKLTVYWPSIKHLATSDSIAKALTGVNRPTANRN